MYRFIPTLTLATSLALAILCEAESRTCPDLLPRMADTMQALRLGTKLSVEEQQTWRQWNARCNDPAWQQALTTALPATIPPPPVRLIPDTATHRASAPPSTWREYPTTTCRTFSTRYRSYTTCNTY